MSSIDNRVVEMQFDNNQFERGVSKTLSSLAALAKGLAMPGATKGLEDVSAASGKVDLGRIGKAVDDIKSKFSALSVVAITALATIASKAVSAGANFAKSFTIAPLQDGLKEYETNLNSIQTILANTGLKGQDGLNKVNGALNELNKYSDQTIYNFSEMARNIGTFTAAGVDLKTSTAAIKGIANLAAVSGSSSEQASTAMYQLSQALAAGRVSLMDWNSVVNAGMGGKVFQNALMETARVHGVAVDDIVKKEGSFRESLKTGWLSSDILTETLSKFTGDLTASQLKSMGYTDQQIAGIIEMGKTAKNAATKVKTFSALVNTLQEAAGSGWGQTWQLIFGDFNEAETLWTGVNNVLSGVINASSNARNKMLGDWKALGGRTALIDTVKYAWADLIAIMKPLHDAFREIFPAKTGKDLYNLTITIRDFVKGLKIGSDTADKVKRTFAGVFAIFDIGAQLVKGLIKVFAHVFNSLTEGSGHVLDFTANIGDFLVKIDKLIKSGTGFQRFFDNIGVALAAPIELLKGLAAAIANFFSGKGLSSGPVTKAFDRVMQRLQPLEALAQAVERVWGGLWDKLQTVMKIMAPFATAVSDAFSRLGQSIADAVQKGDFSGILDAINTGLFGGLVLALRKFLKGGIKIDPSGGFLGTMKDTLEGLTGTLKAMQTQLKAKALKDIAIAIGILALSLVALSLIDSQKLSKALAAMAVMFTQLMAGMAVFQKISKGGGFVKMPAAAAALLLLAGAILVLTLAVAALSRLDWNQLAKGLTGTIVLLGGVAAAAKLMSGNSGGLIRAGAGMIAVALAIKVLASAVSDFAQMDWATMARGFAGVGAALTSLAIFTRLADLNKAGIANGAGLILLGAALKVIASAVGDFAGMDWVSLGKGFASMAVALGLIAAAMALLPPNMLLTSAGLLAVAASLVVISQALKTMGGMTWDEIAKGLVTLAGSLVIITAAMYGMTMALPGAAALVVVAGALAILTPVLIALGSMSWGEIAKGLTTLGLALAIVGAAGLVLTPVIPTLLGLGVAITLLGVGTLAAGLGLLAFSAGLTALSVAGAAGAAALTAIAGAIIGLIPMAMAAVGRGIVLLAGIIAHSGPQFTAAMTTLMLALLKAINNVAPQVISTIMRLIQNLLTAVQNNMPGFIQKGANIIVSLLQGIANNLPRIITAATNVITQFLNGIANNLPKIIQSGVNLIVKFIEGLATAIRQNSARVGAAGGDLASAIVEGMVKGIGGGIGSVVSAAKHMAQSALNAAKHFLGIASPSKEFTKLGKWSSLGMAKGIDKYSGAVDNATVKMGRSALESMTKTISGLGNMIQAPVEIQPTIRPVLDLTEVQKGTSKIDSMLQTTPLNVGTSWQQATDASNGYQANRLAQVAPDGTTLNDNLTFVQNNYSPKAISQAEIYRNTKNQISVAKGALKS